MRRTLAKNRIRRSLAAVIGLGTALGVVPLGAQQNTPPVPTAVTPDAARTRAELEMLRYLGQSGDPLADAFFPPELVMQHQQAIGLTGEQRTAIVNVIAEAQPRFVEAQWQLQPETAALAELIRGDRVNEQQVLAQIDRVLDIERQIKRLQVEMLIRIKNQLTLEQQQQLARLGPVRLRGLLNSERAKGLRPVGMFMPPDPFMFQQGVVAPGHEYWLEGSTHWPDGFNDWLDPSHPAPVEWTPHIPPLGG
jgi:Spy/CpxP family protein refolding chaperone